MSEDAELLETPTAVEAKSRARAIINRSKNNVDHYNSQFDYLSADTRCVVGPMIEAHNQLASDVAWLLLAIETLLPQPKETDSNE